MSIVKVSREFDTEALDQLGVKLRSGAEAVREIARSLREMRDALDESRAGLRRYVGMSANQIAAVEAGNRSLSLDEADRILAWMIAVANGHEPDVIDDDPEPEPVAEVIELRQEDLEVFASPDDEPSSA